MPTIVSPAYNAGAVDPNGATMAKGLNSIGSVFDDVMTPALKREAFIKQQTQNQNTQALMTDAATKARGGPIDPGLLTSHLIGSGYSPTDFSSGQAVAGGFSQGPNAPAIGINLAIQGKPTAQQAQQNAIDLQNNTASNTPVPVLGSNGAPTYSNNRAIATGSAGPVQPILSDSQVKGAVAAPALLPPLRPGEQIAPLSNDQRTFAGIPNYAPAPPETVASLGLPAGTNVERKSDGSLTAPADLQSPGNKAISPGFQNLIDGQVKTLQESKNKITSAVLPALDSLSRISDAANKGIYAGKGAEFQTDVASVLAKMGIGDATKLANTQAFNQSVAQEVLRNSQALGGGRGVTRGNVALTRLANGIDQEVSPEALQEMIAVNAQNAQSQILRHNHDVAALSQVPGFAGVEKLLGVDPGQYGAAQRTQPTNAAPSPAAPQPRGLSAPQPQTGTPQGLPAGAFAGADGQYYVPDTARPGKFLHVQPGS